MIIVLLAVSYLVFSGNQNYRIALELLQQDWHAIARTLYCLLIAAVIIIFIIWPAFAFNEKRKEKEIRSEEE